MKYTAYKSILKTEIAVCFMIAIARFNYIKTPYLWETSFNRYQICLFAFWLLVPLWIYLNNKLELRDDFLVYKKIIGQNLEMNYEEITYVKIYTHSGKYRRHCMKVVGDNTHKVINISLFPYKDLVYDIEKICKEHSIELDTSELEIGFIEWC